MTRASLWRGAYACSSDNPFSNLFDFFDRDNKHVTIHQRATTVDSSTIDFITNDVLDVSAAIFLVICHDPER